MARTMCRFVQSGQNTSRKLIVQLRLNFTYLCAGHLDGGARNVLGQANAKQQSLSCTYRTSNMSIVFGQPPSSSAATKVISSVKITGSIQSALPVGREALTRLGGKAKVAAAAKGGESDFPEDKIQIPVGITPQNLKNYTLYDVLGFSGEWGAAADTEGNR
jgi:hypothetical protein